MARDRTYPIKWESSAGGGTENDIQPTPLNPAEDYIMVNGVLFQRYEGPGERDHTDDEAVGIERDDSNPDRLTLWDEENTTPISLTDVLKRYPPNHIYGLNISYVNAYTIQIGIGQARDGSDSVNLDVTSTINVAITSSGANGLDTGSEAANTTYYIWLIKNLTTGTSAGLLSTSSTSPTMPSGYTVKRLIGAVRNNNDGDFLRYTQHGKGNSRRVLYDVSSWTYLMALSGGDATDWTNVDCSSLIPATSTVGYFFLNAWLGNGNLRPNGSSANPIIQIQPGEGCVFWMQTDSSQVVEYTCASSPQGYLDVHVHGYVEDL